MSPGRRAIAVVRTATVVAGGAVAVHQLRYLLGYGGDASRALRDQGHAYFDALLPVLAILAGLTVLSAILAGLVGTRTVRAPRSPLLMSLAYAAAILVVFGAQEIGEGLLVAGHPGGVGAVLAHGGLIVLPLAFGFGWLAWVSLRGLDALERGVDASRRRRRNALGAALRLRSAVLRPARAAFVAGAGPRAPPSNRVRSITV